MTNPATPPAQRWMPIARRLNQHSGLDAWEALPGATMTMAEARALLRSGIVTMAQRREGGWTTQMVLYLTRTRRRE